MPPHHARHRSGPGSSRASGVALLVLVLAAVSTAQSPRVLPADDLPPEISAGTAQVLVLTDQVVPGLDVPVVLDGQAVTLRLQPHSVRAPGFRLLVAGADGVPRPAPASPSAVVRGTVLEWPGSVVTGSLRAGRLRVLVRPELADAIAGGHVIEPLQGGAPGEQAHGASPERPA